MSIRSYLSSFGIHTAQTSVAEKLRSGLSGGVAILLLMLALHHLPHAAQPLFIVASMASSAAVLYTLPHSPLAQPWNLVGGHLVSALAGLLCSLFIPEPVLAAGAAVGSAILAMEFLRCLHPPSASTALMMVLAGSQFHDLGWQWAICIVAINTGISLLLALAINNLLPGRRYPMRATPEHTPPRPAPFVALEQADLEWALKQLDSVIDVSEEDLAEIYTLALQHAKSRLGDARP